MATWGAGTGSFWERRQNAQHKDSIMGGSPSQSLKRQRWFRGPLMGAMPTALGGHVWNEFVATTHAHAKPWAWHPIQTLAGPLGTLLKKGDRHRQVLQTLAGPLGSDSPALRLALRLGQFCYFPGNSHTGSKWAGSSAMHWTARFISTNDGPSVGKSRHRLPMAPAQRGKSFFSNQSRASS